jgi:hypothetical protein
MTGLVGGGSLQGQLARQQEIAAVALGDLHHVSAVAEICYVFFQNDFHLKLSSVAGGAVILELRPVCLIRGQPKVCAATDYRAVPQ